MSPEQINLTQTTFKDVLPIKEVAEELFYNRRFELGPSLKSLFSGGMVQQGQALMGMIGTAVACLKQPRIIIPHVQD
jgi:hypothetical protein